MGFIWLSACWTTLCLCSMVTLATQLNLVLLNPDIVSSYGSRCLDGTASGYYWRPANSPANDTKWVVYLQGGGACFSKDTCTQRTKTILGSSRNWSSSIQDNDNVLSDDPAVNPDFGGWNAVFIPYCGGDVHSGQQTIVNSWGMYFAGHNTVRAILDTLIKTEKLGAATEVMLSGTSAGGIGAFQHANYLMQLLPNTQVKAVPQCGWFFPNVSNYQDFEQGKMTIWNGTVGKLWNSFHDAVCVAAIGEDAAYQCQTLDVLYPYIKTPVFTIENQFDTNQIFVQLGAPQNSSSIPYIKYFGGRMRTSLTQVAASPKRDALYSLSCLDHCVDMRLDNHVYINGTQVTFREALGIWYFDRAPPSQSLIWQDVCPGDLPCNPTCTDQQHKGQQERSVHDDWDTGLF